MEDIVKARLKVCRRDAAASVKGGNVMAEGTFKCVGHCIIMIILNLTVFMMRTLVLQPRAQILTRKLHETPNYQRTMKNLDLLSNSQLRGSEVPT